MRFTLVASCSALLLAACATSKPPAPAVAEVSPTGVPGSAAATSYQKITATVRAVDVAKRTLTLEGADGRTETVQVPPEVKRFAEVAVGDTIEVDVKEGLLLEYQPAGSDAVAPQAVVTGARAPGGEPPGAAVAGGVQATVTVVGIDAKTRIVQLQDPNGGRYQVKAGPKVQLEKLKVGDRLLATYVASVAITLEKPARK